MDGSKSIYVSGVWTHHKLTRDRSGLLGWVESPLLRRGTWLPGMVVRQAPQVEIVCHLCCVGRLSNRPEAFTAAARLPGRPPAGVQWRGRPSFFLTEEDVDFSRRGGGPPPPHVSSGDRLFFPDCSVVPAPRVLQVHLPMIG